MIMANATMKVRLVAVVAAGLLLAACSDGGETGPSAEDGDGSQGKSLIALNLSVTSNLWQQEAMNLIKAQAKTPPYDELVELRVDVAGQDVSQQIQLIQNQVAAGAKAIIIYPSSETALSPAIEAACRRDVVVFTYGGEVSAPCAYSVVEDYRAGAYNQMAWLGDYMTENSLVNLAVITGPAGLVAEVEQQKGFQEALNEYPNLKVVATASGDWDIAKIKTAFANAYAAHPDIQGVWLSFGCGEVWQVLQAAGKPMIPCTGGGVNEERTMMLPPEQGGINAPMTSLVSSTATGELAFILAVKALSGESVAQNTILPNPALTAEQLKMGTNPAEGANVYPASDVPAGFWPDIWNPLVEQGLEAALNGTPDKVSTAKPCSEVPGCTETAT